MTESLRKPSKISNTCPVQSGHFPQNRPLQGGHSEKHFGRTPAHVLLDETISGNAKAAFGVMSLRVRRGMRTVEIGLRLLGRLVDRKGRTTAQGWIEELTAAGHLRAIKSGPGKRNAYELLSPIFQGVAHDAPTPEIAKEPSAVALSCGNCHRAVKALGKEGYCRICVSDANRLRAWKAAQAELGPEATEEQIVHHLNIRKLTAGWRKVMRRAAA